MFNNQQITSNSLIKKKHTNKNKTYWCAPRKVKSTADVIKFDNLLTLNGKPKKKRRKRVRKNIKKLKRIDILAQPKSTRYLPDYKYQSSNYTKRFTTKHKVTGVSLNKASNHISSRKSLKPTKLKTTKNISENFMVKSKKKKSLPIVLPKKMGLRLFSIVTKKLKELTDSKNI